ncbi:MAG: hypothetical protein IPK22_19360 [Verrucomicrobiaceae bacterium]|nr:hypothetical protein [Verrucomicrobiaceae bacterium]
MGESARTNWKIDNGTLAVQSPHTTAPGHLSVFVEGSSRPLFGSKSSEKGTLFFKPSAPFVRGQSYRFTIETGASSSGGYFSLDQSDPVRPRVHLSPNTSLVPANTLKLYLDFSEPMEQGVFLKHLTLQKRNGEEVAGAFRETELWSPDGKRLTVMLHPGRQKTGVNLHVDEGPVLIAGEHYRLVASGQWRSTSGVPISKEGVFDLEPIVADHEQPDPARWQIHPPKAGTTEPLVVITNELFEPQIFARALQVKQTPGDAEAKVIDLQHIEWRFTPEAPWKPGKHEITIDPELEDLAGNTTQRPFEVDLSAKLPHPNLRTLSIQISPP